MYSAAEIQELEQNRVFCSVCLEDFDDEAHVPRVHAGADCGHSMCHPCFMQMRTVDNRCATCRTEFCTSQSCNPINKPLKSICGKIKEAKLEKVQLTTAVHHLIETIKERTEELDTVMAAHPIELPPHLMPYEDQQEEEPKLNDAEQMYETERARFLVHAHGTEWPLMKNWQLKEAVEIYCKLLMENYKLQSRRLQLELDLDLLKEQCMFVVTEVLTTSLEDHHICEPSTTTGVPHCERACCDAQEEEDDEEDEDEDEEETEEESEEESEEGESEEEEIEEDPNR